MANPLVISTTANQWQKVASGVTSGFLWIVDSSPDYKFTYRMYNDATPVTLSEAVVLPLPGYLINQDVAEPIDIYIYTERKTGTLTDAGRLRLDV
jgi:hypothetical protein